VEAAPVRAAVGGQEAVEEQVVRVLAVVAVAPGLALALAARAAAEVAGQVAELAKGPRREDG